MCYYIKVSALKSRLRLGLLGFEDEFSTVEYVLWIRHVVCLNMDYCI